MNGVEISEVPKFLTSCPTNLTHSITIAEPSDAVHLYVILFHLDGVVSFFEYSCPTTAEFEDEDFFTWS